ncbi:MAG: class I SAM-dependent methyltransferase [Vulcanimicrobiaceae bacterium]
MKKQLNEIWRDVWQAVAIDDLEVGEGCSDPWTQIHTPIVNRWLATLPPGPICEMGCGLGQWTRYYARVGREAVGIDLVSDAVEKASKKASDLGLSKARYVVADARKMPFEDRTFAGVSSFGVVEHFWDADTQSLIDETFRILLPGGRLLLTTPNVWSMHSLTRPILQALGKWNLGLERSFSPSRLASYCSRAGFAIVEKGVLVSGTLFGAVLTERIPGLDALSRWIERRQSLLGFVSYVIAERPRV